MQVRRRQPDREIVVAGEGPVDQLLGLRHPVPGRAASVDDIDDLVARTPESSATRRHRRAAGPRGPGHRPRRRRGRGVGPRRGPHGAGRVRHAARRHRGPPGAARRCRASTCRSSTGCRRSTTPPACSRPRSTARRPSTRVVVVVGGGYIGLEMAEAFVAAGRRGHAGRGGRPASCRTLDADMARRRSARRRSTGPGASTCGSATRAARRSSDGRRSWPAASGCRPTSWSSGSGVGPERRPGRRRRARARREGRRSGSIAASGPRPRACGRRATAASRSTWSPGRRSTSPLGTVANKQGRVAGHQHGRRLRRVPRRAGHRGHARSASVEIGRTGLSRARGRRSTASATSTATVEGDEPGRLLARAPSRITAQGPRRAWAAGRLLGAQIVRQEGAAKRIDVLATAIQAGMTVDDWSSSTSATRRRSARCGTRCTTSARQPGAELLDERRPEPTFI